ncbi:MAG: MFS transporter [Cyanobacteria bacterium J06627_8]
MTAPQGQSLAVSLDSTPNWQYRLWLICICAGMLVYFAQVTALFPVLPLYLTREWQDAPIGLVVAALAAGLLCFRPSVGWMIDRWGRKVVLWLGLGIMLVILPMYGWATSIAWLIGIRIAHGISQAAFATASQTMLADLVPPEQRTAMLGYLGMSNTIGFSIGPALGAWVFHVYGFDRVVLVQIGLTLLGVMISLPLPWLATASAAKSDREDAFQASPRDQLTESSPRDLKTHARSNRYSQQRQPFPWEIVSRFPVRDATLVFFVGSFLHGGVVTFLPLFLSNSALFFSLNALVAISVRFSLGRWGHRISRQWVVSLGVLFSGTALVGMALAQVIQDGGADRTLVLWSILYGIGFGSLFPVLSAIVSLAAPIAVRGRVYSVFLAGFDGGMTLGGAGVQLLIPLFPLYGLFMMLGSIGCGTSLVAFRQFAQPIAIARSPGKSDSRTQ